VPSQIEGWIFRLTAGHFLVYSYSDKKVTKEAPLRRLRRSSQKAEAR
jgi:hypothetical protein